MRIKLLWCREITLEALFPTHMAVFAALKPLLNASGAENMSTGPYS
jgi:hypothetical protein